jgi:hypothetical protein
MGRARAVGVWIAVAAAIAAAGGALAGRSATPAPAAAPTSTPDGPVPAAEALGPSRSLLGGALRFALPTAWEVQRVVRDGAAEGVALYVPCPPLDPTPHSANVNLLAEPNPAGEDLASWSARRLAVAAPRRIVEERIEPAWRTVVSHGEDRAARYVVVERLGVSSRGKVHAVAAFPCLPEMGAAWFERAAVDVDRFLASVALEGAAPSAARVGWDGRSLRLRGAGPTLAAGR